MEKSTVEKSGVEKPTDLQRILDDLDSMGKELDKLQNEMNKHLALRVALLQKIAKMVKTEEREIVFEKTERVKVRKKKSVVK